VGLIAQPNEQVPALQAGGRILTAQFPGPSLRLSPGFHISGLRPCRPAHPDEEEFEILADGQGSGRLAGSRCQGTGGAPAPRQAARRLGEWRSRLDARGNRRRLA